MQKNIVEKNSIHLKCHRCSHSWNYSGKNLYAAMCPHCRLLLSVRKHRILQTDLGIRARGQPTETDRIALESNPVHES